MRTNPITIVGIVFILLGIIAFAYQGITYTSRQTIIDIGPFKARIELKISHEELSEMVGTTRPRISLFMQLFRNLKLIETNLDRFLVIDEKRLTSYLDVRAAGHGSARRADPDRTRPVVEHSLFTKLAGRPTATIGR